MKQRYSILIALLFAVALLLITLPRDLALPIQAQNIANTPSSKQTGVHWTNAHSQTFTITTYIYLPMVKKSIKDTLEGQNLLANPGFEGIGYPPDNNQPNWDNWTRDTFDGEVYGEISTPEGWVTWWEEGDFNRPECRIIANESPYSDNGRIHRGYHSGNCFTFYGKQNAGYYQTVENITPGQSVTGAFYAHAWSCDDDSGVSCGDPEAFSFRVGIDPKGGTDPFSTDVIWSEPHYNYDTYDLVGPITVTAGTEGRVTFYMQAYGKQAYKHNEAYWDDPALVIVE